MLRKSSLFEEVLTELSLTWSVDALAVLRRVESQQYSLNQDGLVEYIKALVLLGKFDRNDLRVRLV